MNPTLRDALLSLVDDLQTAKDFAIEQAPDVVQQMVMYTAVRHWLTAGLLLLAAAATLALYRFIWASTATWEDQGDAVITRAFAGVGAILLAFFMSVGATGSAFIAIKATWFPKWFIVEKLMSVL